MRLLSRCASVLLFVALACAPARAQTFTRATTTFPAAGVLIPTVSIAFGNGTFVALGMKGRPSTSPFVSSLSAYTSTDGSVWTERVINIPDVSFSNHGVVRFIGGQFIFSGTTASGSYVARSTNGAAWTVTNPANLSSLNGFAQIISSSDTAVGFFGTTLSSSADGGATWTARTASGVSSTVPYTDLAYGAGRFVLTATGTATKVWTSTDAATWTEILAGQQSSGRIAFGNGIFVLTGTNYKTSADGINFTTRATPTGFSLTGTNLLRFVGDRFLYAQFALNSSFQLVPDLFGSPDGLTWTRVAGYATDLATFGPLDFAEGNNRLVAVGYQNTGSQISPANSAVAAVLDTTNLPPLPSAPAAPLISTAPTAVNAVAGGSATFSVVATGTGNTYQWRKDGAAIAGATSATLTLTNVSSANAGSYTVAITNSIGTTTSTAVTLTLVSASAVGRIINLSILTSISFAGDEFTLGYVVGGDGTSGAKPLVIRAAGPSLGALGVPGTLEDPKFEIFAGASKTGENNDWGGSATLTNALAAVGAFAYTGPTSKDAAVSANITTRDNSVKVLASGSGTGTVIAEIYDATPSGSVTAATPRLLNVSVLKNIGAKLIAGFVIGGSTSKTVLIRAIGPGLSVVGVTSGVVADPQLALFNSASTKIGENNDWGGTAALGTAFTAVGAFNIPTTSKDAAILQTLQPGSYTVEVTGGGGTSGLAVIEVYDVP